MTSRTLSFAVALFSTFQFAKNSFADTLEIPGKPAFERITITDFVGDRLVFRGLSGETVRLDIRRARLIQLDRAPTFSKAESARGKGVWDEALSLYAAALRDEPPGPLHDLVLFRQMECLELAGQFDEAVSQWSDLLLKSPSQALIATPRHPQPPGAAANHVARDRLGGLIRQLTASPTAAGAVQSARRLLLELLIFDEADPLPPEFQPSATTSQPLLFARPERSQAQVELPADSLVFEAADAAVQQHDFNRAVRLLDAALPFCTAAGADARA